MQNNTPQTPEARIKAAIEFATDRIILRWHQTRAQLGFDPIVVVAAPDAPLGRRFIEQKLGAEAAEAVTGPCVFTLPEAAFFAIWQGPGAEHDREMLGRMLEQLNPREGDMKIACFVNGNAVTWRVARGPASSGGLLEKPREEKSATDELGQVIERRDEALRALYTARADGSSPETIDSAVKAYEDLIAKELELREKIRVARLLQKPEAPAGANVGGVN